jgi:1A family penicillin-binding protein
MKQKIRYYWLWLKHKVELVLASVKIRIVEMRKRIDKRKFWMRVLMVALGGMVLSVILLMILLVWFSKDLPTPTSVVRREGFASRIYDRNGELLYDVYKDAKRTPVVWEDIPEYLKQATVAVEDKDFYKHQGFDPLTPFRIIKNVFYFGKITGGSTLTQQLSRNVLLSTERTVTRKIRELILSIQIEAKYSKDEILLMYLNEAPYGGASWGVGSAVEQYFGKSVKDLNLAESAILAGLPQLPSVYSPFSKTPTAYVDRSRHVLNRMVEDGYISQDLMDQTMEVVKGYEFKDGRTTIAAPHFVLWVKEVLSEKYGEEVVEGGGLQITTSLDLEMQKEAEKIVGEEIDKAESMGISNGAALVVDPVTGQVLAMVGSRDYFSDKTDGKFNVVTQSLRQPGSAIKPITYLTAIRKGWTASSLIMDAPVVFPGGPGQKDYAPNNYNGKFNGPMSLKEALGNSINTTAVKMLANVGLKNMLQQAYDMGLNTLEPNSENMKRFGLAVTLGGAEVKMTEMAAAYSSFANGGKKVELTGVLKVEDRNGRVLEEFKQIEGRQVMSPQEAFIISEILMDNSARQLTFGAVNGLIIPNYQVAVKTGTTNDKRDNWAIGWTPNLLTLSWVGNNDNSEMGRVASGVSGATPIWRRIMVEGIKGRPKQDFPIPDKIVNIEVDAVSGYPAHDGFPAKKAYFIDGTQPKTADPIHLKLKVCRDKDGLAPPADVSSGNYDEKEYFRFREEDPVSSDGKNRWQEGIDSWIAGLENKDKYYPPSDYCRSDGLVTVDFENPSNESKQNNEFTVKLRTSSVNKIEEAKLWVNGEERKTWKDRPFETELNLNNGKYTLRAWVKDKEGNEASREIKIGVNMDWNFQPSPTPMPTAIPSPTIILSPSIVPSIVPTGI